MKAVCTFIAVVILGVALPSFAEQKGQWSLDVTGVPPLGLRVAYHFSDHWNVRAIGGGGVSFTERNFFNVTGDFRYVFSPRRSTSPYLIGSFAYLYNYRVVTDDATGESRLETHNGLFGAGAGLRQALSRRWSAFGEATLRHGTAPGIFRGTWGRLALDDSNSVQVRLGFTFTFHQPKK